MFGADGGDDFTIVNPNSKAKLAKLFDPGYSAYSPPKEPKMKSLATRSQTNTVQLSVLMGKTVEAFKMEKGRYKSYGKVGAALLGNEDQAHFQLYIYRNDERRITSADITTAFKFTVHENNYAMFNDRNGDPWSLHFEKASEMSEFCKEVGLAKWRSSEGKTKKLVQDLALGNKDKSIESNDRVVALYRVIPIGPDKQLCPELPKRNLVSNAEDDIWEVGLVGAFVKSGRVVILSHDNLGNWKKVVPKGCSLMLEIEIEDIFTKDAPKKLEHPAHASVSSANWKQPEKVAENQVKQNLVARMAKMGQLVPFPNFPSGESDSRSCEELNDHLLLPSVLQDDSSKVTSDSEESGKQSEVAVVTHSGGGKPASETPICQLKNIRHPPPEDGSRTLANDISVSAQFNVLFSEMRTSNSELRMNMTRIYDKIESLVNKIEVSNEGTGHKFDSVQKQLDVLTASHQHAGSHMNRQLEVHRGQDGVLNRKFAEISEGTNNAEVEMLTCRILELEEYLKAANAASDALQVRVSELNEHIEMTEKQKELTENMKETEGKCCQTEGKGDHRDCDCPSVTRSRTLETCIKALESRNNDLETANVQLESKVAQLSSELALVLKEKREIQDKSRYEKGDCEKAISSLENELAALKVECTHLRAKALPEDSSEATAAKPDVTEIVKKLMNLTYRSLKLQLSKETDMAKFVQNSLAETLRMVTNSYLEQFTDLGEKCSVSSESSRASMLLSSNPSSMSVGSSGFDKYPQSNSTPSTSIVVDVSIESDSSGSNIGSSRRFSPANSPLPRTPNDVEEYCIKNDPSSSDCNVPRQLLVKNDLTNSDLGGPNSETEGVSTSKLNDDTQNKSVYSSPLKLDGREDDVDTNRSNSCGAKVTLDAATSKPPVPSRRNVDKLGNKLSFEQPSKPEETILAADILLGGSDSDSMASSELDRNNLIRSARPSSDLSYPFVPLISSEPPPVMSTPSPSPPNYTSADVSVSISEEIKDSASPNTPVKDDEVWRPQPPPLFDDDDDDSSDWMM